MIFYLQKVLCIISLISEEKRNERGPSCFKLNIKQMNMKSFFSIPNPPNGQQISRRLALRTKPDGASSVGLGCSLVISSWLVQTTSLRLLIIRSTVMNKLPCGWRFTRHTAYSSNPPSEALADLSHLPHSS